MRGWYLHYKIRNKRMLCNPCKCAIHARKGVNDLEFGGVLRKMRKGAGMSQEALAERLHISRSNVSRLESNKLELKAVDLFRWARETNSQDVIIALTFNVDITAVADIVANLVDVANVGMSLLGGIF